MATILALFAGIFGNTAVINLAVQLIENYMAQNQATADARAQMVAIVAALRIMGLKGLQSRFETEAQQKQSIDDKWKQADTLTMKPPDSTPKA